MTKTLEMNGPARKTLASQLDRLDGILDGLSEGLDQAVAQAVREAVGLAVREAVQAVLAELLTNPLLRAQLQKPAAAQPAPPDEQCAFRIDFPAWRATHAERDRRLLDDLMLGERTLDVAGKYGLSPGRVSQLRREFLTDWRRFISEPPVA